MLDLPTLLLQIAVILFVARLAGWLFRRLHQPRVVGEMVAGLILGPSVLGSIAPGMATTLFPVANLGFLNALSQIGIILFMFLVGLELDPRLLRKRGYTALVTSTVSIVVPFVLGGLLAIYLYPRLADTSVTLTHFALFIATALSITAFPVLARILTEHNLLRTQVGMVAIASAAVGDVTAWCILAGIVLLVRAPAGAVPLWLTLLLVSAYIGGMIFVARPLLRTLERRPREHGGITHETLGIIFLVLLVSAFITERLGLHALFGAFLAGAMMPRARDFVAGIVEKIEALAVVLLLPLFFAFTGLRTNLGTLANADLWLWCGLIVAVAVMGKCGGATLAAYGSGMSWREAGAVGALMNARGLIELIVLNIGLDAGIISPTLFTMMVVMALVTTLMATPMLEWIYPTWVRQRDIARATELGPEAMSVS